ncbi:MAG: metal ABC transporter ATP-binding protein [Nitrospinota bacterium]
MSEPRFPYCGHRHVEPVPAAPALVTRDLKVTYPGAHAPALRGVDLRVPVGARVALVGPNGAGKSTLIKAAAGLLAPFSGDVRIFGLPIRECHHRMGYLPQRSELDWRFPVSVRELVLTGRHVHLGWLRRPKEEDLAIASQALDLLGLSSVAGRQIGRLSGGQQQRALLARALAQEADLLLLDEPLNAVDAETRDIVAKVLADLKRQEKTVVIATHDLGRLEADFDGALYLSEGRQTPPPPGSFVAAPVDASARGSAPTPGDDPERP